MRNVGVGTLLFLCCLGSTIFGGAGAQGIHKDYPQVRAVTAFIDVDKNGYMIERDFISEFVYLY